MVAASLHHLTDPSFQELLHLFIWPELHNTKENWGIYYKVSVFKPFLRIASLSVSHVKSRFTILDVMPR